jgi:hypothetical protein
MKFSLLFSTVSWPILLTCFNKLTHDLFYVYGRRTIISDFRASGKIDLYKSGTVAV